MITILNYTTLKLCSYFHSFLLCLITILNYTTLKHENVHVVQQSRLITILNYTTLKLCPRSRIGSRCLITILNYTTLKQAYKQNFDLELFDYHLKLHYSQTL